MVVRKQASYGHAESVEILGDPTSVVFANFAILDKNKKVLSLSNSHPLHDSLLHEKERGQESQDGYDRCR